MEQDGVMSAGRARPGRMRSATIGRSPRRTPASGTRAGQASAARGGRIAGDALAAATCGVTVFVCVLLSLIYTREAGRVAALWPANAVLLAAVLRNPPRRLPAFVLSGLVANVLADLVMGDPLLTGLYLAAVNAAEVVICAGVLRRTLPHGIDLTRPRDLAIFGLAAGVAAPAIAGGAAALTLLAARGAPFGLTFKTWFMADALGLLTLTPAFLVVSPAQFADLWRPERRWKAIAMALLLGAALAAVFGQTRYPLMFTLPPVLMLIAFQLDLAAAAMAILITAAVSAVAAVLGRAPAGLGYGGFTERLFVQQLFLAVGVLSTLPVASAITQRRRLEVSLQAARAEAEAAVVAKSDFLANMSHELRTPLTSIIGFAGLLAESAKLGPEEKRFAHRIESASDALLAVINDVLDFSRLEAGGVELEARVFALKPLIDGALDLVAEQAKAKGLKLEARIDAGAPATLVGDAGRLRQVLLNLLSNAVKFTAEGGVSVDVAGAAEAGAYRLKVQVSDTGIGVAPEMLDRLFERFVQADGSITRRFGGTGLGLAISRRLIALMGGEIGADSRPGEGATFWFEALLPLDVAQDLTIAGGRTPAPAPVPLPPARVLMVDDSEANRDLVSTWLTALAVEVDIACNGAEAVAAVMARDYDLVLMDLHMPVMDGLEATRAIRAQGPRYALLPIVALSADVQPEQVARCREAGMNGHVGKPIVPADLHATLERWLNMAEAA